MQDIRDGHLFRARAKAVAANKRCSSDRNRALIAVVDRELGETKQSTPSTTIATASQARWSGKLDSASAMLKSADDPEGLAEFARIELARGHGAVAERALEQAVSRAEQRAGKPGDWQWPTTMRDRVMQIRVTRDGTRIVTADSEGRVMIWDRASLRVIREITLEAYPRWMEVSPNGKWLVTSGSSPMPTRVYELATGSAIAEWKPEGGPVAFDDANHVLLAERHDILVTELPSKTEVARIAIAQPLGTLVVTAGKIVGGDSNSGRVLIWDAKDYAVVREYTLGGQISEMRASEHGKLASIVDGGISLHDVEGTPPALIVGRFYQLAIDETGQRIASTTYDGKLVTYRTDDKKHEVERTIAAKRNNDALTFHAGFLLGGGYDACDVWNADTGAWVMTFLGTAPWASSLAFDATGNRLAVGSGAGHVTVWSLTGGEVATHTMRPGETVKFLAFGANGDLAAGSDAWNQRTLNSTVFVWGAAGKQKWWTELDRLSSMSYQPNTSTLATTSNVVSGDGQLNKLRLWTESGKLLREKPLEFYRAFHWSADGTAFVGGTNSQLVSMPLDDDEKSTRVDIPHYYSAQNPSGTLLATTSDDGKIAFWDLVKKEPSRIVFDERGAQTTMTWTPNGKIFIHAARETTTLWNPDTGAKLAELVGPANVATVAVRPDGRLVAVGYYDGRVILWSMETAKPIATLHAPGALAAYVVTPDGAIDGRLPDDTLGWRVGDLVLPGRGAYDRQRVPGLLAQRVAQLTEATQPRASADGAAAPPALPTCYREPERGQRNIRSSSISSDGKTVHMCLDYSYATKLTNNVRPPAMCFDVDAITGKYTPREPTPREALGLGAPGPSIEDVDGVVKVCKGPSCYEVKVHEPHDASLRYVVDDDARILVTSWRIAEGRDAVLTYDLRTGKRLSQFIAVNESTEYSFLDQTLVVTGSLFDPRRGRQIGELPISNFFSPSQTRVSENIWAFADTKPKVFLQNVKTGRIVGRFKIPKAACTNDADATWMSCDGVTLLAAGSRVMVLPSVRSGDVMVLDQRGKLLAEHHLPICRQ